jgi:hypothetical protein
MYASVEVLRGQPLGGIAPVGRGAGTGQQGVCRNGIKRKNVGAEVFFPGLTELNSPMVRNRGFDTAGLY